MKLFACAFWLALLAAAEPNPQPIRLSFDLEGHAVWLPVRINGSPPERFLFDTGAGGIVVNRRFGDALKLRYLEEISQPNAGAGDQSTQIALLEDVSYELPSGVILRPRRSVAIRLDEVARSYGAPMNGIIGGDLIEKYVVALDADTRTLTLYDPSAFVYRGGGAVLPIEVRDKHAYVRCTVGLAGWPPVEGTFMIDSPGRDTVLFTEPFQREHGLRAAMAMLLPQRATGVGGRFSDFVGRIEFLRIGPYRIQAPVAHFPDARAGAFARTDMAGVISWELLRRFRVILDYHRSRIILEPNGHLNESCPTDAAGMSVRSVLNDYRAYEVDVVAAGGPADQAGVAAGDRIIAIGGRNADDLRLWEIRPLLQQAGRDIRIELVRNGERKSALLKLRELL
jgi:hypothetical protein